MRERICGVTRRGFFVSVGVGGGLSAAEIPWSETAWAEGLFLDDPRLLVEFSGAAARLGLPGEEFRLTRPYLTEHGDVRVLYQTLGLEKTRAGEFVVAPLAREMIERWPGLGVGDPLGYNVALPFPGFSGEDVGLGVDKIVSGRFLGPDPGRFLSSGEWGDLKAWSFENYVLQRIGETVERSLIGQLAVAVGLDRGAALSVPVPALVVQPEWEYGCSRVETWEGRISYYSSSGCYGCSTDLRMANGEIFNENAPTLAFMRAPLNSFVLIENPSNGRSVRARVTDRGGFEQRGRIADLSSSLARQLGVYTDDSVYISLLDC